MAPTSAFPLMLEISDAKGVYLIDPAGKRYLDFIAGISVSSLGHKYPAVVKAVQNQAETFMHTMVYGEYVLSPQVELASLLTEQLPAQLDSVYFVNSGTEATEGAMKLAKRVTGRREIISCRKAYHGSSQGALSLMSEDQFTAPFRPLLPNINHIEYNCEYCLRHITDKTAAVIVEPVQAEWGVRPPFDNYLTKLRAKCTETGTLLILDEIQTGYGRTGSLFAFDKYGIVPDILLLAKGMGGGMPIGAFVSSKENMRYFSDHPILGHITTFGGHPVSCAAALATLKTLLSENYVSEVAKKEEYIKSRLEHSLIQEIRSSGLLMAVQLDSFDRVGNVIKHCMDSGLIVDWFLFNDSCIRIAPPLVITMEEIDEACDLLLAALDKVM
jgi:acetylornithine/succinyldiaminopimelate/putrescine aminotransferase